MGFLKRLFEKKECDICGGEIGLLGNKKLEDGNCCKECAAKLSPWFSERRHSTVSQIKEQLAYREANAAELQNSFRPNRTLGEYYKMHVMDENGCPSRFVVSAADDYVEKNADIIRFTDVTSCNVDIRESRTEEKYTNKNNERVSYDPPRYEFRYEFFIELGINSPWFDEIRFNVNRGSVKMVSQLPAFGGIGQIMGANSGFDPSYNPEYRKYQMMCDDIVEIVRLGQSGQPQTPAPGADAFGSPAASLDPQRIAAFMQKEMEVQQSAMMEGRDPSAALYAFVLAEYEAEQTDAAWKNYLSMRCDALKASGAPQAQAEPAAQAAPAAAAPEICPDCGAADQTGKFCTFCGKVLR